MENKRPRTDGQGCEDCPPCYNLVQDAVNQHRKELKELDNVENQYFLKYDYYHLRRFDILSFCY